MEEYKVKLTERALQDLNDIYRYISQALLEQETALKLIVRIESAILSLETMPLRCPVRRRGVYANKGYRQLFIGNYTIIFRVNEAKKLVTVVTIQYSRRLS